MLKFNRMNELLRYDHVTGIFTWIAKPSRRVCVGDVAGGHHGKGYLQIRIDGISYFSHRLAWFYMTGSWPIHGIDHVNGVRSDNRWVNLRDVSKSVNQQNFRLPMRHNKVGMLGVSLVPCGKYKAQIHVNGKRLFLGHHDTAESARIAYLNAKRKYHAGCTI
jgi:AP2 domain.